MTIGEYIKQTDRDTYNRLIKLCKGKVDKPKPKKIILGDSVENLMKANSYSRSGGAIKQRRWS